MARPYTDLTNTATMRRLATDLYNLQRPCNDGRGVECVRGVCAYLWRGELQSARNVCDNEQDKISNYPDIYDLVVKSGLYTPPKFPWN